MSENFKDDVAPAWDDEDRRIRDALVEGGLKPEAKHRIAAGIASKLELSLEQLTSTPPPGNFQSPAQRPAASILSRRRALIGTATAASFAGIGLWSLLSQRALSKEEFLSVCEEQFYAAMEDGLWSNKFDSFPPDVSELAFHFQISPDGQRRLPGTAISETGNAWRFRLGGGKQLVVFQFIAAKEVAGINTIPRRFGPNSGQLKWAAKRDANQLLAVATTAGFGSFLEAGLA